MAEHHGWVEVLAPLLILISTFITALRLLEAALWTAIYRLWSPFTDYESARYFSLTSFTTIG